MKTIARVQNSEGQHQVTFGSGETARSLNIPPKASGFGSSISGGELLFLALATCYCNDLYREAAKQGILVEEVEVEVEGDFPAEGQPAQNVTYRAKVKAQATEPEIRDLMRLTDQVAEIQNTLRVATPVTLSTVEVESS
jgi:uncharacterized OsmC-like protein